MASAMLASSLARRVRAAGSECAQVGADIAIGGVAGFDSLMDKASTHRIRATCRARLYIHDYIWEHANPDARSAILAAFDHSPMDVELPLATNPQGWFERVYKPLFAQAGVRASIAHVDGFYRDKVALWSDFVAAARSAGIPTVAPIFTPNGGQEKAGPFPTAEWDFVRDAARKGGGLTIDSPPRFFLARPATYQQFVIDEITWAKSAGLHSAFIISPQKSGGDFLRDTQQVVARLERANALPAEFIVENYEPHPAPGYRNLVGQEDDPETIVGVAFWLAENAHTAKPQGGRR